jgi:hypothetical protein
LVGGQVVRDRRASGDDQSFERRAPQRPHTEPKTQTRRTRAATPLFAGGSLDEELAEAHSSRKIARVAEKSRRSRSPLCSSADASLSALGASEAQGAAESPTNGATRCAAAPTSHARFGRSQSLPGAISILPAEGRKPWRSRSFPLPARLQRA